MATKAAKGWGSNVFPEFDVAICADCGATTFFMQPGKSNLLETCKHQIVDVVEEGSRRA